MTEQDVAMIGQTAKAVVKEYSKAKRRSFYIKFALIVAAIVLISTFASSKKTASLPQDDHIAAIRIDGPIMSDTPASMGNLYQGIKEAFENEKVKGVMLLISSPGGVSSIAEPLYQELMYRKDLHKKPIIAVCEDMCASAAYMIATTADQIYANNESVVGSIGAFIQSFDAVEAAEALKIKPRFYASGENKGLLNPLVPMNPEQDKFITSFVERGHQRFINKVITQRGERLNKTVRANPTPSNPVFSGMFYDAEQALELGLIDGIGYTQSVSRQAFPDMEVLDYTPKPRLEDVFIEAFASAKHSMSAMRLFTNMNW